MSLDMAIITFPGSNCDYDCYKAGELVGAQPRYVWHRETDLGNPDVVIRRAASATATTCAPAPSRGSAR